MSRKDYFEYKIALENFPSLNETKFRFEKYIKMIILI